MGEDNKLIEIKSEQTYYCYDWIIKLKCLCSNCLQKEKSIKSPTFTTKSILSNFWFFVLRFKAETMFLKLWAPSTDFNNCNLRISVRDITKKVCYSVEYQEIELGSTFIVDPTSRENLYSTDLKFINFSLINNCDNYIPDGVLTLVVEIFKTVIEVPIRNSATNLEKALKNLQLNEELSDVTLVAGGREFRAHKAILAARSSVFLAKFKDTVDATLENKIVIEDVSAEAMGRVLDYVYSGKVEKENFEDVGAIGEVLVVADKYSLDELVDICEDAMISLLSTDNVLKFLASAEVFQLDSLKNKAINFIAQNVKRVVETDEFKDFLDPSRHCLMKEIVLAISSKSDGNAEIGKL